MDYSLEETAAQLGITPTALHQWNAQFALLLSACAYQELALKGLAVQRRFTAADIAMLQHAQLLLQRGHTYDQVRRALTSQQARQSIDTTAPVVALEHRAHRANSPAGLQTRGAQVGAGPDAPSAAPAAVEQMSHRLMAQLGDTLRRPWLKQEAVQGQAQHWRARLPRHWSSWLSASLALCIIAILAGVSVVVLFENPLVDNSQQRDTTMPAASAAPTLNSTLLPGVQSAPIAVPITPSAVLAATPRATVALPATSPPTLVTPPSMTAALPVVTSVALPLPRTATMGDQGGKTVRVRKAASLKAAALNVALAAGTQVSIIGGPVEAEGYTWWNVEVDGHQGWCVCTFMPLDRSLELLGPSVATVLHKAS